MTSFDILYLVTFGYGLAAFFYLAAWIFKKPQLGPIGTWVALLGLLANTVGIGLRWNESYKLGIGHVPLSNLYESLVFFAWTIVALYLYVERRYKNRTLGAFVMPLALLAMAYANFSSRVPANIQPLMPALKSTWLHVHVATCFIGYAAFAIAFGLSLMYLVKSSQKDAGSRLTALFPSPGVLDELTYQMVVFGFLFLTVGIITGAVWANSAWGRYWGWDSKETWSLITWLIYAAMLHFRLMRGWQGKRIAYISVVGFMAVLFTYFGVNMLLTGLHSYAR